MIVMPIDTEGIAMTSTAIRPIAVELDQDTRDGLARLAEARQRTSHWLMREAITQYVAREEKRENYRQDGLRAWNDYQTTGLHASQEEADTWLAKLEAGQDVEPPACHA